MKRSIVVAALVALTALPALADPTGDVRAGMMKFAGLKSYQMSTTSGGRPIVMQMVNPDAMRIDAGGMQMVRIGKTMYMKMPGASGWMKTENTRGGGGAEMADKVREMATDPNGVKVTDLGMRSAGGETLHAYDVTQKDGTKMVLSIGRDGYVHQLDPKGSGQNAPIRFSKFNAVAPIRAPM
jgi:hypothetical protein